MSIMAHYAKVLDWSTFRLNLSCTPPYNADFDGDEMNLHVPQSLEARAEAEKMMLTPYMIVSPQSNAPVMKIVQDSLLGASLITKRDIFINRELMMHLLMWVKKFDGRIPIPAIMVPRKNVQGGETYADGYDGLWTGKQLYSMILPRINMQKNSNGAPDEQGLTDLSVTDSYVFIEDGVLHTGNIDKKSSGSGTNALIHITWLEVGPMARDLIDDTQLVVNAWLIHWGFA